MSPDDFAGEAGAAVEIMMARTPPPEKGGDPTNEYGGCGDHDEGGNGDCGEYDEDE